MITNPSQLSNEQKELLHAAADNQGTLTLARRADTRGLAVRGKQNRKFFQAADPSYATRYVESLRQLVDRAMVDLFRGGLLARGFRPAVQALS